jgi:hypothetical protein
MYKFLMSKLGESDNKICLKRGLSKMPVLYLPEQKMLVACNRVVKSIKENEIIKPYLMEVPDKYHQFFELFEVDINFSTDSANTSISEIFVVLNNSFNDSQIFCI